MHILLSGLIFFASVCSAQQNPKQQTQVDTLKLFDPKPEPNEFASIEMFKNFVLLNQLPYAVTIQGKQVQVKSQKELFDKLKRQKAQVVKSKFYIIVDSSFSYSKIVGIIDELKKIGIKNYRVINFDSYFQSEESVVLQQPSVVTKVLGANDSTSFNIEITDANYQVSFLGKKTEFATSAELDSFITSNIGLIDKNRIVLIGSSNTQYERLKPIIEILKRHSFFRFQMVTK